MKSLLILLALIASPAFTQVTLTASPTSGTGSVAPTLTLAAPVGSTCTASGGWTGAKAPGTHALPAITSTTTYSISCLPPVNGSASLSWTAPTQNTDGSALTDLAGFKVYKGSTASSLSVLQTINSPTTLSYSATGLTVGTTYFAVSAFNTAGIESALSAVGSKVVAAPVALVASVTVTVSKVPNPPTNFTIAAVDGVASVPVFKVTPTGKRSPEVAAFTRQGVPCSGNVLFYFRDQPYRRIDSADVTFWRVVPGEVAAPCG